MIEYQGQEIYKNKRAKKKLQDWIQVFHLFLALSDANGVHNGLSRPMYERYEYYIKEINTARRAIENHWTIVKGLSGRKWA